MYREDDYLSLSGIQHFAFCRRQWALIHIEQQWNENVRTIEGQIIHKRTHNFELKEKRPGLIVSRSMYVFSRTLGTSGICDVVEFHESDEGISLFSHKGLYIPVPIEYKRGRPKDNKADELQLCAQAMCLEEMMSCSIFEGYLFYDAVKRRSKIEFTDELRMETKKMFQEMHDYYRKEYTPKVKMTKSCNACSLINICQPKLDNKRDVSEYIDKRIGGD